MSSPNPPRATIPTNQTVAGCGPSAFDALRVAMARRSRCAMGKRRCTHRSTRGFGHGNVLPVNVQARGEGPPAPIALGSRDALRPTMTRSLRAASVLVLVLSPLAPLAAACGSSPATVSAPPLPAADAGSPPTTDASQSIADGGTVIGPAPSRRRAGRGAAGQERLADRYPNVVRRSNLVLTTANVAPKDSMALGNGTLGVAAWAANGFTAQLNRADTFPDRKSLGQVVIPGLAPLSTATDFSGHVDLYDAMLLESGGGMTATAFVRADAPELVVDVTGADPRRPLNPRRFNSGPAALRPASPRTESRPYPRPGRTPPASAPPISRSDPSPRSRSAGGTSPPQWLTHSPSR